MIDLHIFEIEGCDFVVAETAQEAVALMAEWSGNRVSDFDADECGMWPDEKPFTIQNAYDDGKAVTKLPAEWASENGKGFLASTEY